MTTSNTGTEVPRVFVSYAREDQKTAERLYDELAVAGLAPWSDTRDLLPGQQWRLILREKIQESDYCIILLSRQSAEKRGFYQKEIRLALDALSEMPSSRIYIIPVRIDPVVPLHGELRDLQWLDLFPSFEAAVEKILEVITCNEARRKSRLGGGELSAFKKGLRIRATSVRLVPWDQTSHSETRIQPPSEVAPQFKQFPPPSAKQIDAILVEPTEVQFPTDLTRVADGLAAQGTDSVDTSGEMGARLHTDTDKNISVRGRCPACKEGLLVHEFLGASFNVTCTDCDYYDHLLIGWPG